MTDTTIPDDDELEDPRDVLIAELKAQLDQAQPPAQLRERLERVQRRNSELEPLPAEIAGLKRQLGLARAGVRPDSVMGQLVATQAQADGIDDPDRVAGLAHQLRDELNGDRGRRLEEGEKCRSTGKPPPSALRNWRTRVTPPPR